MKSSSRWDKSPKQSIEQECERRGRPAVVKSCVVLLNGKPVDDELIFSRSVGRRLNGSAPAKPPDELGHDGSSGGRPAAQPSRGRRFPQPLTAPEDRPA